MDLNSLVNGSYGMIKNDFQYVRIEPVDDPKINNVLFSLYNQLINPIRGIEAREREICAKREKIMDINCVIYDFFKRVLKLSLPFGIGLIALAFAIASVDESHPLVVFATEIAELANKVTGMTMDIGAPRIISILVYFIVQFGGIYLVTLPIPIVIVLIRNAILQKKISKINKEISEIEQDIEARVTEISDVVSFVPPAYRYSAALAYFVDSYANSRASNLKEAVIRFDEYLHRQNVENSLNRIEGLLADVAYNQLVQIEQLERINRNIWRTGILF